MEFNLNYMNLISYNHQYQNELEIFFNKMYDYLGFNLAITQKDNDIINIKTVYGNGGEFWLIEQDKKIIGTIGIKNIDYPIGELKRFYILPEHQGKGYGKILLNTLIDFAQANKYKKIRLDTTSKSSVAISLFEKYKFKYIDKYNDDEYAEYFMELLLDDK